MTERLFGNPKIQAVITEITGSTKSGLVVSGETPEIAKILPLLRESHREHISGGGTIVFDHTAMPYSIPKKK